MCCCACVCVCVSVHNVCKSLLRKEGSRAGGGEVRDGWATLVVQQSESGGRLSLACVNVINTYTLLTADVAAPVEDAVTLLLAFLSSGVVASAAAQQVAALDAMRRHVTGAVPGPEGTRLLVGLAEVGRPLIIDEVTLSRVLEEGVFDSQCLYPSSGLTMLLHHHL